MALIVVSDTGPLLCTGLAGAPMIRLLAASVSGRLIVPEAVRMELARLEREGHPPSVRDAAARAVAHADRLFTVHDEALDGARVRNVRSEVNASDRQRRGRDGGAARRSANLGESQAIVLAESKRAILLTNDRSAMDVGEQHSLPVATFVTLLRAEVRGGRLDAARGVEFANQARQARCFPGQHVVNALTLTTGHVPPGLI